jgi:hypothetical protein
MWPLPQPATAQAASVAFRLCPNLPPPKQCPGHNLRADLQQGRSAGCRAASTEPCSLALAHWLQPAVHGPQCAPIRQPLSRSRSCISGHGLTKFERGRKGAALACRASLSLLVVVWPAASFRCGSGVALAQGGRPAHQSRRPSRTGRSPPRPQWLPRRGGRWTPRRAAEHVRLSVYGPQLYFHFVSYILNGRESAVTCSAHRVRTRFALFVSQHLEKCLFVGP